MKFPNIRAPPLHESEYVFLRVYGERAGQERSDGRINRPLLDLPPTRDGAGRTNERNRAAKPLDEEIPTYRNQLTPTKVSQLQVVTAVLDSIQILPHLHVFLDPPSTLLQATRGMRIFNQASSKKFKPVLQERGHGDQIGKGPANLA